jgi:hypothetical protein
MTARLKDAVAGIKPGTRYRLPPNTPPSWFCDALGEARRARRHEVPIRIELIDNPRTVEGFLLGVCDFPKSRHGGVSLRTAAAIELKVACDEIEAFTLLPQHG